MTMKQQMNILRCCRGSKQMFGVDWVVKRLQIYSLAFTVAPPSYIQATQAAISILFMKKCEQHF